MRCILNLTNGLRTKCKPTPLVSYIGLPLYFKYKKSKWRHFFHIFLHVFPLVLILLFIEKIESVYNCEPDQFQCKNGNCVLGVSLCDGVSDCSDGSDEADCEDLKTCYPPRWFQCSGARELCVSAELLCNGYENCPRGEDELKCSSHLSNISTTAFNTSYWHSTQRNCTQFEFTCKMDNSCIPLNFMCDGKRDCYDGSDESSDCLKAQNHCQTFFCDNKHCLESLKWVCDGVDDCGDGSDEKNCSKVQSCLLESGNFLCSDNVTCLPLEKACDGLNDCPDGTDELLQCLATKNCTDSPCPPASKCHMLPQYGVTCICPKGFRYSVTKSMCVDINECEETYGICSQKCRNFPGTFQCICDDGYVLNADKLSCSALSEEEALLFYTTQITVMGINLHSRRLYTVAANLSKVIGVTYDGKHVYWTNIREGDESIVRANTNGSEQLVIHSTGLELPEDLAIDWLTGNIYFSDNFKHHIAVCSQDGLFCTALVTEGVHQPRALAVWPERGQIFWSDWGYRPAIMRASMDGESATSLVNRTIYWPNGVTLDMHNDRLYWVDAKFATIECVRTDGTDRRTVLEDILKHPYGLAIYEDRLYWSDWITKSIHSCNKFTGKDHMVLAKDRTIYSVYIYHPSKQMKTPHACEQNFCSHLCLLTENNGSSCACPEGMKLANDHMTCEKYFKNERLYIGAGSQLLEVEHTKFGGLTITASYNTHLFIHQMAYNTVNDTIFIADNLQHVISEYDIKRHSMKIWVKKNLGNVTDLAFDHLAHNLYWSDSDRHIIEVISLQTGSRAVVCFYGGLKAPIGFVIIPEEGVMFVALKNKDYIHIIKRSLGNHGQSTHVLERGIGSGEINFVADVATHTLYWTESNWNEISFTNYRRIDVFTLREHLYQPYSMSLVGSNLFWTELRSNAVYWINKNEMAALQHFDIDIDDNMYRTRSPAQAMVLLGVNASTIVDHPCQHWNDGCSHVCITFTKYKGSCLCPPGMVFLNANNRTCIESINCEFRCNSGECLMQTHVCNDRKDCPDGSDEILCGDKNKKNKKILCSIEEFRCQNGEQCIEEEKRCDNTIHCYDGSDEEHCEKFDKSKKCHFHQHVCSNGQCVDFSVLCDGFNDCGDNSDEIHCTLTGFTTDLKPVCGKNMFQCTSGTCISKSWECDGVIDCPDASDEHEKCAAVRECPPETYKCFLGQCIDKRLVCDGNSDCSDGSDEINCKVEEMQVSCFDKFECPSNKTICLELSAKCNSIAECPRGEDELNCDDVCHLYEFQCKSNKRCIRREFVCDHDVDCEDGSDERECTHHNTTQPSHEHMCASNAYSCGNGLCVDLMRVCDGFEDCETGADEGPLCKTACLSFRNGEGLVCENECRPTPAGAVCSCYKGYRLDSDQRSCTDINECEETVPCGQICENTNGSYRCSCYPDFMLSTDKTTCKSIESANSILFSTHSEVRSRTDMPVTLKIVWSANDSKIISFDVNSRTRNGYFTTDSEFILYQVNITNGKIGMGLLVNQPSKVSVDWITDNVYVISIDQVFVIKVCSFKSKMCGTIIKTMPNQIIKALAVDAYNKKLFFVALQRQSFGEYKSRIAISNLDGARRHYILTKEKSFITALACDPYKKTLYFTDIHQRTLQSISYRIIRSSIEPITIIQKTAAIIKPIDMTWYENEVFIVNLASKEAGRCQLFDDHRCKTFDLNVLNGENILVDGVSRQPLKRNPCATAECRGMCVQSELSYVCMCADSIVSETKKCDSFNHVTSGDLLEVTMTTNVKSNTLAASITILAIMILLSGLGLIYCRYRNKEPRDLIRNLHFQNPLSVYFSNHEIFNNNVDGKVNENCSTNISSPFNMKDEEVKVNWKVRALLGKSSTGEGGQSQFEPVKQIPHLSTMKLTPRIVIEDTDMDEHVDGRAIK
uniref:EGF-like domain-containing protein n=1 Tax=Glossina brevipalpis TaxID=37001 RepID=A0A1A9W8J7_9MUSC